MKQIIKTAAIGLAVKPDGRFLLTQRHQPTAPIWDKKWNVPGGGIEWGETPEQALVREFREELGVVPTILYPHPIPVTALWYGKDTGFDVDAHVMLLMYIVDIGDQSIDITLDPEQETGDYRWFTLDEAKKVETLPHTIEKVEYALQLLKKNGILAEIKDA